MRKDNNRILQDPVEVGLNSARRRRTRKRVLRVIAIGTLLLVLLAIAYAALSTNVFTMIAGYIKEESAFIAAIVAIGMLLVMVFNLNVMIRKKKRKMKKKRKK